MTVTAIYLYLIQSEKDVDSEKLAQMLGQTVPGASDPKTLMTIVETCPAIVRGQETDLIISEGINSDGETYRQVMTSFEGKGGPALLVLSEPVKRWNRESIDNFLASLR